LCGVGLTYGERFAAKLKETKGDPIEEMRNATAEEYVTWGKKPILEQWIPVKNGEDVRIFGVTSDIGDVSSGGKIFRFDRAGLSFISYGPTIFIGGSLIFRAGSVCLNSRLSAAKWISAMVMLQPGLAAAQ
jgi:hypothetical protein